MTILRCGGLSLLVASCVWAQTATTTTGTTSTDTSANGTTSTTTTAPAPANPAQPKLIFLSGIVAMDDGSPLPEGVSIQSFCGAVKRAMSYVNVNGSFGFQWTSTNTSFGDASQAGRTSGSAGSLTGSRTGSRGMDPISNCELTAELVGYTASRVALSGRNPQGVSDVGTIVMHRVATGEGHTVSILALRAPKDARKSFERGRDLAASGKQPAAIASFRKAVELYPEYADGWLGMGRAQRKSGEISDARNSLQKAMDLDNKLVGPWQELGYMACDTAQWNDAARYLDLAVRLDPMGSSIAWYFDGVANYNLGRFELAERSVRAEMKLDGGRNPLADFLLGLVLIARKDLEGGAEELRHYIASAPATNDAAVARRELSRIENRMNH